MARRLQKFFRHM